MDANEYKAKYRSAQRSNSLGSTDWMEQDIGLGTLGQPGMFSGMSQTIGYTGDGTTVTTSSIPSATAYTLSSALSMK